MMNIQETVDLDAFLSELIASDIQNLTRLLGDAAPYQHENEVSAYAGQASYVLTDAVKWLRAFRRGEAVGDGWDVWHGLTDTRAKLDWAVFKAWREAKFRDDEDYLIADAIGAARLWERVNNPAPRTDIDAIMRDFLGDDD